MFAKLGHAVAHHPWWIIAVGRRCSSDRAVCARAPGELGPDELPAGQLRVGEGGRGRHGRVPARPSVLGDVRGQARRSRRTTRADQSKLATIAGELGKARIPGVLEVVSGPEQVSPNGRVQLVQVAFSGDSRDERIQDAVGALRERAAPLFAGTGLVAGLTGDAAIVVDRADASSSGELIVGVATVEEGT